MSVTAKDVKKLRERTGAGMMDCKNALEETDGDIEAAVEYLQTKLRLKTTKKAGRTTAEGLVRAWSNEDNTVGVLVEINSETDFVARNDQFVDFVDTVTGAIAEAGVTSAEEAKETVEIDGKALPDYTADAIVTIGENITLRRVERVEVEDGVVGSYLHAGDQIGVLVKVTGKSDDDAAEFARDVAMHVAAMRPSYLSPDDIDEEAAEKQATIFRAQLAEEGKPDNIIPRIMEGKMKKWRNENSLLEQAFVKDTDKTVHQYQDEVGGITLEGFVRFEVGEGIEKEEDNLAEEVAAQLKSN